MFPLNLTRFCSVGSPSPAADLLLSEDAADTTSDLMLAQMLQMQFDREFDDQLRREEKKFNGDSKGGRLLLFLQGNPHLTKRVRHKQAIYLSTTIYIHFTFYP